MSVVFLTSEERDLYEHYIFKLESSRTAAEAKIYQRKIKAILWKGRTRNETKS